MKKIILKGSQLNKLVRIIKEENENDYYKITAKEYEELMKYASYNSKVTGIKKFNGKPLYIEGNVNLSSTSTEDLGNVLYINGNLDISRTQISSLGNTKVKGYVSDYGTPMERIRIRKEEMAKLADTESRREDGEWDLDNPNIDDEGLAANALFNSLVDDGDLQEMDEDTKQEIESKLQELEELKNRYEDVDGTLEPDEVSDLSDEITDLESEIEELQSGEFADVYFIIPTKYRSYSNTYSFEVIGLRGREYLVGLYEDMYEAAIENQEQLLDDVGIEGISEWLIENNIDKEQVRDEMEEYYRDDITENPEVYFDEDDYELTEEQEKRIEELENQISDLQEQLDNTEEEDEIADLEQQIEELQEELDSIEPDTEPTEEMIDGKVDEYVSRQDEIEWLKELGSDLRNYIDMKGVAQDIVDNDGLGVLSSYDGRYDDVYVTTPDGKKHNFVIVRTN